MTKQFTFEQIKPLLKLSKSEPVDEGPYTMKQWSHSDYYLILNRHNETVGQCSGLQWLRAIPRTQ
jgi:hypothetical protein